MTGQTGLRRRYGFTRTGPLPLRVAAATGLVGGLLAVIAATGGTAHADTTTVGPPVGCTQSMNPVQCENLQPGTARNLSPMSIPWDSVGDATIQGFATQMSVAPSQTVSFKVNAPGISGWHINIFRMGWYQGLGAREWAANVLPSVGLPQTQPPCQVNPGGQVTGLIDCGNWAVSASWQVPSYAVSGLYVALLVRNDTNGASEVPFVVRNDTGHSDIVYQTSDATWEAYNAYNPPGVNNPHGTGIDQGNSLYQCYIACPQGASGAYQTTPATAVSYNRPLQDGGIDQGRDGPFYAEIPLIQFLERNGYDTSYISEVDTDSNSSLLLNHKIFVSSGHDEYWSANMRANVMAARDAGVNLAFFSGNESFWKTTYSSSPVDGVAQRTLGTYKETHDEPPSASAPNQFDPQDPPTWTGSWRDPNGASSGGGQPENAMSGQEFMVNSSGQNDDIQVPFQFAKLALWKNTAVASLTSSSPPVVLGANLGSLTGVASGWGTLGYEWDIDADNGFRPPGVIDMSSTTDNVTSSFSQDYGSFPTGNTTPETHHLTLYRAQSGALVFGAGTVQWSWGLSNSNPMQNGSGASDANMQQFTVNLLAAMGVQPTTLTSGLAAAAATNYSGPPTSAITSPVGGATLTDGASTTITGTASDNNGGVVAGVEISTDTGATWHPVTTMSAASTSVTWSYAWPSAAGAPTTKIETRATDDAGNRETPTDAVTVNVACPCSIFGTGYTPAVADSGSSSPETVGIKFTSDVYGVVNGVRFYKSANNTAIQNNPHVGLLWTASGQLLASATFTNETASGWQSVSFSRPVPINPNTTYVVGYYAPFGHTAVDRGALEPNPLTTGAPSLADSPPLHAVRSTLANGNGEVALGTTGPTFPTNPDVNPGGDDFGVDVSFTIQPSPGAPSKVVAVPGYSSASMTWSPPSSGGPATAYTITPYIGGTAQTPTTVAGNPAPTSAVVLGLTNGSTYTFTVTASNPAGSSAPSAASNAVTPAAGPTIAFVQGSSAHNASVSPTTGLATTFSNPAGVIDRVVVEVVVSGGQNPAVSSVGDSGGDVFTELATQTAGRVQESIWTAMLTNSGGTKPTITVKPAGSANVGVVALEYSGLTTALGAGVLDQFALNSGGGGLFGATASSGATARTCCNTELAVGFYADSGSGASLSAGQGWTSRANDAQANDVEYLAEDKVLANPSNPNATVNQGGFFVPWMMAEVVLKPLPFTPPTVPGAPTGVTATAGDGSATVSWIATSNGGSPITKYTITPFVGTVAQPATTAPNSPPTNSATVTGLAPGTSYTFVVSATNSVGTGPNSAASNAVTPSNLTVPDPPTGVAATPGNGSAAVSWTAPANNGGKPITSYVVTPAIPNNEGFTTLPATTVSGSPAPTSTTITGLSNGTSYVFTVAAVNSVGTGAASAQSTTVTPATVPTAPTSVSASSGPGDGSVTVAWTAANANGSTVTGYVVASYLNGNATGQKVSVSGSMTSVVIGDLIDGDSYTFVVTASNLMGNGPASSSSNSASAVSIPGPVSGVAATAGPESATVSWTAPSGGSAPTSYTVTPYSGTSALAPVQVTGNPPATSTTVTGLSDGTTYTFLVSPADAAGGGQSAQTLPATPEAGPPTCPCTVFGSATPSTPDTGDGNSINVGMVVSVDQPGYIDGVDFYKAIANGGMHVGSLWTASGTLLARATFANETASGWQQVIFANAVSVHPGVEYVVSYFAPQGHYSANSAQFASGGVDTPPLHALANSVAPAGNGLFSYGSAAALPTSSFNATGYGVDAVFTYAPLSAAPSSPGSVIASAGAESATVSWTPATSGPAPTGYAVTPHVGSVNLRPVLVSGSPLATSVTVPGLTDGTTYTFTVTATNSGGSSLPSAASLPATPEASAPACPCTIFGSSTPSTIDSGDGGSIDVGVVFSVDQPGYIEGVSFYKAAGNTGTHVGQLWTSSGSLLAQATFASETATGWQQVLFSSPVAVTPGVVYVASYFAPSGHYSDTPQQFAANGVDNAPLHALASGTAPTGNGVFVYSTGPALPTSSFNATSYGVDVIYQTTP